MKTYQIKIEVAGIASSITRQLFIPSESSFSVLHDEVIAVMDWSGEKTYCYKFKDPERTVTQSESEETLIDEYMRKGAGFTCQVMDEEDPMSLAMKLTVMDVLEDPLCSENSLFCILSNFGKEDLKDVARQLNLSRFSRLKKQGLIYFLAAHILDPKVAYDYFMNAQDEEILFFEECMERAILIDDDNVLASIYFLTAGYCHTNGDNAFVIPDEVKKLYRNIDTELFRRARNRFQLVADYCKAACNLYGTIPLDKMMEIFNDQNEEPLDRAELTEAYARFQQREPYVILHGNRLTDISLYEDGAYRYLLEEQMGKPYYTPPKEQYLKYAFSDYFEESKAFGDLRRYLTMNMEVDWETAQDVCEEVRFNIYCGFPLQDILSEFDAAGIILEEEQTVMQIAPLIMELWCSTRMLANRGFTPDEMAAGMGLPGMNQNRKPPKKRKSEAKVIPFPTDRKKKK